MQNEIQNRLPLLSEPQRSGLVLWVYGTIMAGSGCQRAVVSSLWVLGNFANRNSRRQYLREWRYDGSDRARPCETELDVDADFAPLLGWVTAWWQSDQLLLAIDPTHQGNELSALVISVVYRGCAIPVAWHVHRGGPTEGWLDPLVELIEMLAASVPATMHVSVLCDRGLRNRNLWNTICAQGWHPYIRQPNNVTFQADGGKRLPALNFLPQLGTAWIGHRTAFGPNGKQLRSTMVAIWDVDQKEPWVILTDRSPDAVEPSCYA